MFFKKGDVGRVEALAVRVRLPRRGINPIAWRHYSSNQEPGRTRFAPLGNQSPPLARVGLMGNYSDVARPFRRTRVIESNVTSRAVYFERDL